MLERAYPKPEPEELPSLAHGKVFVCCVLGIDRSVAVASLLKRMRSEGEEHIEVLSGGLMGLELSIHPESTQQTHRLFGEQQVTGKEKEYRQKGKQFLQRTVGPGASLLISLGKQEAVLYPHAVVYLASVFAAQIFVMERRQWERILTLSTAEQDRKLDHAKREGEALVSMARRQLVYAG